MATEFVERELRKFLNSNKAEVVCLKGHWGVGKTWTWENILKACGNSINIKNKKYSYVSLFGVNSLDEFRSAIFYNLISVADLSLKPSFANKFFANEGDTKKFLKRKLSSLKSIPGAKDFVDQSLQLWSEMAMYNNIVCVDDIERRGDKLSIRDILGLVSNLKHEKKNKVVLILNEDTEDMNHADWQAFYEKVIDKTLHFDPSSERNVGISIRGNDEVTQQVRKYCVQLGVKNIRVLEKMSELAEEVQSILKEFGPALISEAIKSLVLLVWVVYEPKHAPLVDFLDKRLAKRYAADESDNPTPSKEVLWHVLLDNYQHYDLTDFDKTLLEAIRKGYFDADKLKLHAKPLHESASAAEALQATIAAWSVYHDSFDDNGREAAEAVFNETLKNVSHTSPINLNGAVDLLRFMDMDDKAKELIDAYLAEKNWSLLELRPHLHDYYKDISDNEFRAEFDKKIASITDERDISAILLYIAEKKAWSREDITKLAALSVEEYYDLFKASRGDQRDSMIGACLRLGEIQGLGQQEKLVGDKAKQALIQIAKESRLNERRLKRFGITLPPPHEG